MLWAVLFIVFPLLIVVYYAFVDAEGNFSFENILGLSDYADIFLLSVELAVIATVICLLIGYPLAYIMAKCSPGKQKFLIMLLMLPMWTNLLIRTYSIMAILDDGGFLNTILQTELHIVGTKGAVVFGMGYDFLPYMVLPIYTCISKIDKNMWEAASDLGCSPFRVIWNVILPLSTSGVVSGVTMVLVPSISTFYISQKMGSAGTTLIGDVIESQFKAAYNPNLGAALSLVLMVMVLVCIAVMNRFSDEEEVATI